VTMPKRFGINTWPRVKALSWLVRPSVNNAEVRVVHQLSIRSMIFPLGVALELRTTEL